jgi:hypothetical protein
MIATSPILGFSGCFHGAVEHPGKMTEKTLQATVQRRLSTPVWRSRINGHALSCLAKSWYLL